MGGLAGNQRCTVLSVVLAAFLGVLAAVIMGGPGHFGWWSAAALGVVIAVALALFFVFVLCGRWQGFDGATRGAAAGGLAAAAPPAAAPPAAAPPAAAPPAAVPPAAAPPVAVMSVPAPASVAEKTATMIDVAAVEAAGEGIKPKGLTAPRDGQADNLKFIEGIGPVLERLCNAHGIFHFDQIAGWEAPEVAWMNSNLKGFKSRVSRDKWVAQARLIGEVGIEEFKRRAETNDY